VLSLAVVWLLIIAYGMTGKYFVLISFWTQKIRQAYFLISLPF
jgi:hypothetical protein